MEEYSPNEACADVHKALHEQRRINMQAYGAMARSNSVPAHSDPDKSQIASLRAPNGFRRNFLNKQADEAGIPFEDRPQVWQRSFMDSIKPLFRVGYFDSILGISLDPDTGARVDPTEGTSSSLTQTALALLKSFIGSGITFLPGAFAQGGWVICLFMLLSIAAVNAICIRLLLTCRERSGCAGYGDIAMMASGRWGSLVVQISLVVSQFSICIAYIIFASQLAGSLGLGAKPGVIFSQLIVVVPLCLVRHVHHLEYPNLISDVLILFGLAVVIGYSVHTILLNGVAGGVVSSKPDTLGLFLGTAVFTFEGIPMILPIMNSMKEPKQFWPLFSSLFVSIAMFFSLFALLGYAAYGTQVNTVVLLNLPESHALVVIVKIGYMLALILGLPLMFLPAARITELWFLGVVDKLQYKWTINMIRLVEVTFFTLIAYMAENCFNRFLAFAGAFCCAPIAFVYPALFHLQLCADTIASKVLDISLVSFGLGAMIFTFSQCL